MKVLYRMNFKCVQCERVLFIKGLLLFDFSAQIFDIACQCNTNRNNLFL